MVRFKNRYLLAEVISFRNKTSNEDASKPNTSVTSATRDDLFQAIKDSIKLNFGDYGLGCLYQALQIKYFSATTGSFIIRCARTYARMLWASLTLLTQIGKETVTIRVRHVGGTIRSCQQELIKINRMLMLSAGASPQAVPAPDEMQVDEDDE